MRRIWALIPLLAMGQTFPAPGPGHSPAGAAATPVTQILFGGSGTVVAAGVSGVFGAPEGFAGIALNATEDKAEQIFLAGTVSDFAVKTSANIGGGTMTITVNKCPGEDAEPCGATALSCTITGANSTCTDGDNFSVALKDRVTVKVSTTAGTTSAAVRWSMKWVGTVDNQSMLLGIHLPTNNANTNCAGLMGGQVGASGTCTEAARLAGAQQSIIPLSTFTATAMYARALDDITGGTCRTITLQKANSNQASWTVNLTDGTTKDVSPSPLSFTAGDSVSIESNPSSNAPTCNDANSSNPVRSIVSVTVALSESSQLSLVPVCSTSIQTNTRYFKAAGSVDAGTSEAAEQIASPAFVAEYVAGALSVAPGTGGSGAKWEFSLRDDAGLVSPVCRVLETETTCTADITSVSVGAGSLVNWTAVPTSAPATTVACLALAVK